ncbi:hypothetical protein RI129_000368 [Pyrocoelia pectoralis]|uniref:Carboxylesterase type B domain-containing protein n=1 Tax=Pyrocoelia pectoralis TaxID=417401 RepID=A0AAN7VTT6_9COLE
MVFLVKKVQFINMFCLFLTVLYVSGSVANDGPLVETSLGKILGFYRSSFEGRVFSAFEGIPYAKPPVGDLRFEAPQPGLPWNDVLNANTLYICKQAPTSFIPVSGSQGNMYHLYLVIGLFHRAISQSGTALMPWALQKAALQKTRKLAESLNCEVTDTRTIVNCLKAIPVDDVVYNTSNFYDLAQFPIAPFAPVFGDRLFNIGFETAVQMQAKVTNSPIYAAIYSYEQSNSLQKVMGVELEGVPHGAEGSLLHDMDFIIKMFPEIQLTDSDILMKDILIDFVTSFAKNGKPQSDEVEWEPVTANDPKYLLINNFNDLNMVAIPELSPKEFWKSMDFIENHRHKPSRDEL